MMAPIGLEESFLGAIQASLSVLLVILYGVVAAKLKLLNPETTKTISKVSVRVFLPALLLTQVGSQLEPSSAHRYLIIAIWAIVCHGLSFLVGIVAHLGLGMPDWVTVALMFNNTTSYPLLLISALEETGVLSSLITTDESTSDAVERAKSYFLVFATISSCLTFAVGPRLIDTEHAPEEDEEEDKGAAAGSVVNGGSGNGQNGQTEDPEAADEHTNLLGSHSNSSTGLAGVSAFLLSRRKRVQKTWDRRSAWVRHETWDKLGPRSKWWLLFGSDFFNAPLLGAILGVIIGLIPALHRAFFNDSQDGGIFTAWLTASLRNIGSIFVPLPILVAGVSLYTSWQKAKENSDGNGKLAKGTTVFVLIVRFILWPVISIAVIYGLASKTGILGDDPMLWFTLMLMPTGPPAMKLITLVQVSGAEEEEETNIAKLLTISYIISPILSFTVVGSLVASRASL